MQSDSACNSCLGRPTVRGFPRRRMAHAWGYLRSELQALPLVPGRVHSVGRKPDCDLSLKVRLPLLCWRARRFGRLSQAHAGACCGWLTRVTRVLVHGSLVVFRVGMQRYMSMTTASRQCSVTSHR